MSSPKLTALIGKTVPLKSDDEFGSLIKPLKKVKVDEESFIVFFVIDIQQKNIYFKLDDKLTKDSVYKYYFFGNNASAGTQYYLSREVDSLKYLITSTFSDLHMFLVKNNLADGKLDSLLKILENEGFITLADKKGKGQINLKKFSILNEEDNIVLDDKFNVNINEVKYNSEAFVRLFIDDDNKKNRYVLAVPMIVLENGEKIILSTHPEYLEIVKRENKLAESETQTGRGKVCYICKERKTDVSSSYSKKFARTGINKIFTTTTVNYAPNFKGYDDVYSVCSKCYKDLRAGEKHIAKQFKSKIAGEDVFLLPEGLLQSFDYKYLNTLKASIDLAFNSHDAEKWIGTVETEKSDSNIAEYIISFVFYKTDGNSVTILETIEDVPTLRFEKIMRILSKHTKALKPHTDNISIGSIYRLIPVKVNKKGEQLDIGRVLSFYKAILSREKISRKVLFDYATEALEKGLTQLNKPEIDNYFNLGVTCFINGGENYFIRRLVYGYLVLFKVCQELEILDKEVFKFNGKVDGLMDSLGMPSKSVVSPTGKIEAYLDRHGFDDESRMLFYLGILVNIVAAAQAKKGHLKKPILKKIQFQGMSKKEVENLYNDIQEKLIQYDLLEGYSVQKVFISSEYIMQKFHEYYGKSKLHWCLNETANVFMIMAGYSYNVPGGSQDSTGESALEASIEELKTT